MATLTGWLSLECFLQRPRTGSRCGRSVSDPREPWPGCLLSAASVIVTGDLLDEIDNAAPKLGFLDAHESLGQGEPLGGGEEIRDIGGGGRFFHSIRRAVQVGRSFKEERHRHL